jgi:hypothetical protein
MTNGRLNQGQVVAVEGVGQREQAQQRRFGGRVLVVRRLQMLGQGVAVVEDDLPEQIGLVREAGENRAGREAGGGRDLAHGGGLIAALVEQAFGRIQQLSPGALFGQGAAGHGVGVGGCGDARGQLIHCCFFGADCRGGGGGAARTVKLNAFSDRLSCRIAMGHYFKFDWILMRQDAAERQCRCKKRPD